MSRPSVGSYPVGTWWPSRLGALALAVLMLMTACATGNSPGAASRGDHLPPRQQAAEAGLPAPGADDAVGGEAVFARLPTNFAPVQVSHSELTTALNMLWLDMPLRVATSRPPLYVGRQLALASVPLSGDAWRSELARAYGRYCESCGTPGDCLTLFEDGPRFQDDDKRRLALALAVEPALAGVDAEVRAMLNPTRALAMLSLGIAGYMALLLAPVPEPVTKSLALAFTVLMWGYLGWEFFDLLRAYAQLDEEAPRASTFEELRAIGERFGRVIGPNSVRILVLVGTAAIGETMSLASKVPKMPGFGQASQRIAARAGMRLLDAAGAERAMVSVSEGSIRLVMAPHVVSMAARGGTGGNPGPSRGRVLPNGHRAWNSFNGFKSAMGPAGPGKQWHHLVEQTPGNVTRFGGEALHNTENVIPLDRSLHARISAFFSSKNPHVTNSYALTVREWIGTQSYEAQRSFGLLVIKKIMMGEW